VVRIRNKARHNAQYGEWVDFHVRRTSCYVAFTKSNERVIFLINVLIFDHSFPDEVREFLQAECQVVDMLLLEDQLALVDDKQWSDKSSSVRRDVDAIMWFVLVN